MSTREREDEQIRSENRKEDATYARIQAERRSKIDNEFIHNTGALRRAKALNALLDRKERVLNGLSEWPEFDWPAFEHLSYPQKEELYQTLSKIRMSDPIADFDLENLIRWAKEIEASLDLTSLHMRSSDYALTVRSYARWLSQFKLELEVLLIELNYYKKM